MIPPEKGLCYHLPEFSTPDVQVLLPNLLKLKSMSDKLRNMSQYVTLCANGQGEFKVSVGLEQVKMEIRFPHCQVPGSTLGEDQRDTDAGQTYFVQTKIQI